MQKIELLPETSGNELSNGLPRHIADSGGLQKSVLLIEDNEDAMFLVRYALQEYGQGEYRLEWAQGLSDGLERLGKGGIDVVLLDLGLPDSSGAASYAWTREVAPHIPVLVLTGDNREETELSIAASGVQDYLVKDRVSGFLLVQAIRQALDAAKRADKKDKAGEAPLISHSEATEMARALERISLNCLEIQNRVIFKIFWKVL